MFYVRLAKGSCTYAIRYKVELSLSVALPGLRSSLRSTVEDGCMLGPRSRETWRQVALVEQQMDRVLREPDDLLQ